MKSKRTRLRLGFMVVMLLLGHPHRVGWTIGAVLLLAGTLLHALGAGYLTKRAALATAGPYRFVRNPLYVGDLLRDLGVLFACHACWHAGTRYVWLIAAAYFAVMYFVLIGPRVLKREEPELEARYGEAYREFVRRVPRFVPRLRPAPGPVEGRFSWETLRTNHEMARFVGMLLLIGITYFRWELFHHDFEMGAVIDDPWEASLFIALPLMLLATKIQGRGLGWRSSVPLGVGRAVCVLRDPLAAAPLVYALFSERWEWAWDPGTWSVALVLCGAGIVLRTLCAQRTGEAGALVRDGPYALVRNPLYVANTLLLAGATVASGLTWLLPGTVLWAISVYTLAVRYEEERLLARFGDEYRAYADEVPRWWPSRLGTVSVGRPLRTFGDAAVTECSRLLILGPFVIKELSLLGLGPG